MPEEVHYDEHLEIVVVRTYGDTSNRQMVASREAVAELCRKHEVAAVLVDARGLASLPSTVQLFEFGTGFIEKAELRSMRLAVVPSEATREDVVFMETVCQNRGAPMRVFADFDDAVAWLKA